MGDYQRQSRSFKNWMERQYGAAFGVTCRDLVEHGAAGGFSGMIYYRETTELYERFEDEIWDALNDDAEEQGLASPLALIGQFSSAQNVGNDAQFRNLLVWYLAERVANEEVDRREEDQDQEMIDAVAGRLEAIGSFYFPEVIENFRNLTDGGSLPYLDVRLQLVDGDWTVWSGDNQYDTDHRGAWGIGVIRPDTTEEDYRMIAKAMVLEAQGAEEMQAEAEQLEIEKDKRVAIEMADTDEDARSAGAGGAGAEESIACSPTPFQRAFADSAGEVDFYWFG